MTMKHPGDTTRGGGDHWKLFACVLRLQMEKSRKANSLCQHFWLRAERWGVQREGGVKETTRSYPHPFAENDPTAVPRVGLS